MMDIDYSRWCATDRLQRFLSEPFIFEKNVYATNGHVAIRRAVKKTDPYAEKTVGLYPYLADIFQTEREFLGWITFSAELRSEYPVVIRLRCVNPIGENAYVCYDKGAAVRVGDVVIDRGFIGLVADTFRDYPARFYSLPASSHGKKNHPAKLFLRKGSCYA